MSLNDKKGVLKTHKGHGFKSPVVPFEPKAGKNVAQVLDGLRDISFQGRSLGTAFQVWRRALEDNTTMFLGLAGAMVPAGLRKTLVRAIEDRYVDVIVSTGANLFHDLHQALGGIYYKCSPNVNDVALRKARMDRMYDVVASDLEMVQVDEFSARLAVERFTGKSITTREYFYEVGKWLLERGQEDSLLAAAAKQSLPIYCPAFGDSGFGIALATQGPESRAIQFDVLRDVYEMGRICLESKTTGVLFIGGGHPKNFTQQAWVVAEYLADEELGGHKYCIQLTQDAPHWGGLSGCTFEESTSWGKIDFEANTVAAYVDATVGFPLLVQGLVDLQMEKKRKGKPAFVQGERLGIVPPGARAKEPVTA